MIKIQTRRYKIMDSMAPDSMCIFADSKALLRLWALMLEQVGVRLRKNEKIIGIEVTTNTDDSDVAKTWITYRLGDQVLSESWDIIGIKSGKPQAVQV